MTDTLREAQMKARLQILLQAVRQTQQNMINMFNELHAIGNELNDYLTEVGTPNCEEFDPHEYFKQVREGIIGTGEGDQEETVETDEPESGNDQHPRPNPPNEPDPWGFT